MPCVIHAAHPQGSPCKSPFTCRKRCVLKQHESKERGTACDGADKHEARRTTSKQPNQKPAETHKQVMLDPEIDLVLSRGAGIWSLVRCIECESRSEDQTLILYTSRHTPDRKNKHYTIPKVSQRRRAFHLHTTRTRGYRGSARGPIGGFVLGTEEQNEWMVNCCGQDWNDLVCFWPRIYAIRILKGFNDPYSVPYMQTPPSESFILLEAPSFIPIFVILSSSIRGILCPTDAYAI